MVAPDVEVEGKGIILISSEEGETEVNNDKFLKVLKWGFFVWAEVLGYDGSCAFTLVNIAPV